MRDDWNSPARSAVGPRVVSLLLLLAPAAVLGIAAVGHESPLLAVGAVAELLGGLLFIRHRRVWRPPASGSVILIYVMALGWLWFVTRTDPTSFDRLARGLFVLTAVGLLAGHDLLRTGLEPRRRASNWGRRLAGRTRWPATPAAFADLPEVRALRDALRDDPGPAVGLLADPRPEVRTAALVALWPRTYWRPGEADVVMAAVRRAVEPGVRAAGVAALSCATDPAIVTDLGGFLRDGSPEVRQAALAALLGGAANRWPLIREAVRDALADPHLAGDGALTGVGRLSALAACDLTAWANEPEPLAGRSIRTLVGHYAVELQATDRPHALPAEVARQITDPLTPPALRVELATLLRDLGQMTPDLLDRMTDIDQPGPLRMLAAETLLAWNPANPDAVDVLRGLGRQSNRDTALAIARLVQKYLKLDMGLPAGPLSPTGKPAAEVAKRVFQWATNRAAAEPADAQRLWAGNGPTRLKDTTLHHPLG